MKRTLSATELHVRKWTKSTDKRRGRVQVIAKRHTKELNDMVTGFLKELPQGCTPDEAQTIFNVYNARWKKHCANMNARHEWINADPLLFEKNVRLLNERVLKKSQPWAWVWRHRIWPAMPFILLGVAIYLVVDVLLPYLGYPIY